MRNVFVSAVVDETVKVRMGKYPLSHTVNIGDQLSLSLPFDLEKRKETLLWLATQLEIEAQKL